MSGDSQSVPPESSPLDIPGDFRLLLAAATMVGVRARCGEDRASCAQAADLAARDAEAVIERLGVDTVSQARVGRLLKLLRSVREEVYESYIPTLLLARINAELKDQTP